MSTSTTELPVFARLIAVFALFTFLSGCTSDEAPPAQVPTTEVPAAVNSPATLDVPIPDKPLAVMDLIEDYSEEVADRWVGFGDKLRRRDFVAAGEWLSEDFGGHAVDGLAQLEGGTVVERMQSQGFDVASARVLGRDEFIDSWSELIGPWQRVDSVIWKVKGAEFQAGGRPWGRVKTKVAALGLGPAGGPIAVTIWAHARVAKTQGAWSTTGFALDSMSVQQREAALFTDVSTAVGVAHAGIRFGQPGNTSFAWNGGACGDVDGDGLFDLFLPSQPQAHLYRGKETGFVEEARKRGLGVSGGTGAVFFDHDNDGDQDLALGDVGWRESGDVRGNPLRFFANDGEGQFTEEGAELGFNALTNAFTLTVLDADLDGNLDVFVCNYGRVEHVPNNSWIQATNGTPNMLFHNVPDGGFVETAASVGLVDTGWSYAAAAADYDEDGDTDLYVANDYGRNQLWVNDGGRFSEQADDAGIADLGSGMGAAFGDLNCDGKLDLYVSNMSSTAGNRILKRLSNELKERGTLLKMAAGNSIFVGGGDAGYSRLPASNGGIGGSWAWSPALFDLNSDGRLDIYCASGFVTGDTLADT